MEVELLHIRKSEDRGHAEFGWLDSRHTFSFGEYYDERFMGFGPIRVINDDRVAGAGGFPEHPHANMEIVTYVLEGALRHRDSLGTGSVIKPGDVQRMSAGTGIRHSEFNESQTKPVHFLQIWIVPERRGLTPAYEQKTIAPEEKRAKLRLIAAPDGRDGALRVHQDIRLFASLLAKDERVVHPLAQDRAAWVQLARGAVTVNGIRLDAGDGLAISDVPSLSVAGVGEESELLLFDVAS